MALRQHMSKVSGAIAVSLVLALAGCGGGSAPETYYYRLTAPASVGTRAGGPLPGAAEVPPLRGDGLLNGRAILHADGSGSVDGYNYQVWWQAPGVMLQESLIDALRSANA